MRPFPLLFAAMIVCAPIVSAQTDSSKEPPATLRSTLLAQLRSTHNKSEWFVPLNTAVAGLTAEQARWVPKNETGQTDPDANHSVGMLAYHLLFWNTHALAQLRGEKPGADPKDNEETFNKFDAAAWNKTVQDLDHVMSGIEETLERADDAKLARTAPLYAHIATHNAYHTGQILYVRKLEGAWNPAQGVK